jgi:hypothetical protein
MIVAAICTGAWFFYTGRKKALKSKKGGISRLNKVIFGVSALPIASLMIS